jgi:hypothetical protein
MWLIRSPNLCGRYFCVAGRRYFETISVNAGGRLEKLSHPRLFSIQSGPK